MKTKRRSLLTSLLALAGLGPLGAKGAVGSASRSMEKKSPVAPSSPTLSRGFGESSSSSAKFEPKAASYSSSASGGHCGIAHQYSDRPVVKTLVEEGPGPPGEAPRRRRIVRKFDARGRLVSLSESWTTAGKRAGDCWYFEN